LNGKASTTDVTLEEKPWSELERRKATFNLKPKKSVREHQGSVPGQTGNSARLLTLNISALA